MSTFHAQQARKQASQAFQEAQEYAQRAGMRLSRDPVDGYWLHYDGRMRFVRSLSEVRGTIDYIDPSWPDRCEAEELEHHRVFDR
jgi:hypothetical protein